MLHQITQYIKDNNYTPKVIQEQELGDALNALIELFDEQNPVVIIKRSNGTDDLVVVNTEFVARWNVMSTSGTSTQGQTDKGL